MPSPRLLPALAVLGLLASAPLAARADEATPTRAADLEAQLGEWLAGLLGPGLDLGARPLPVAADGDHFNITLAPPDWVAQNFVRTPSFALTLQATPQDGGRWALAGMQIPSPLVLSLPMRQGPGTTVVSQDVTFSAAAQEFRGALDPSFATESHFDADLTGLHVVGPTTDTSTARSEAHVSWQPAGDGRINLTAQSRSEQSVSLSKTPSGDRVRTSFVHADSSTRINGLSPTQLATLIRSLAVLLPTLPATRDSLTPDQRTLARDAVFALRDLAGGVQGRQRLEGARVQGGGFDGSLDNLDAGFKLGVDDGKLLLTCDVSLAGFDSPLIPPGFVRDHLPRQIVLKPRISGVPRDDLVKLMLRAIDSDQADMTELQEQVLALLGAGPLEIGLDEVSFDLGKASLHGTGALDIASPIDITGEAEIAMEGLDDLIKQASLAPEAKQAVPTLIVLRGIGRQDGTRTVWNITWQNGKVMVNDTDLSGLVPK